MTIKVTETVTISKEVEINCSKDPLDGEVELKAREAAYEELPDYDAAGWELEDSEGPVFSKV